MNPYTEMTAVEQTASAQVPDLLETYPVERYEALRNDEISADEFVDDLIRHVDVSLAREALLDPINRT
jgi:hypothetical protein